ncbi:NRDE-2, necessary for RNA interference-domain-containing protein [Cryomyces antarcticus]
MSQLERTRVPKFASFRPKPITPLPSEEAATSERDSNDEHRSKETKVESAPRPEPQVAAWDDDAEQFAVDKQGDPNNLRYGSMHRYDIPLYRRAGAGIVMGLSTSERIDRSATTEREVTLVDFSRPRSGRVERLLTAKRSRAEGQTLRLVAAITEKDQQLDQTLDYVSLRPSKTRSSEWRPEEARRPSFSGQELGSASPSPPRNQDYRSIEGKAKPSLLPADVDLRFGNTSESETETAMKTEQELRRTGAKLSRRTKEEPRNVEAWLDLIDHQDAMAQSNSTNAEIRNISDIKLSIYEQALKTVEKKQHERIRLLLGMMGEGSKVWESKKLSSRWREILHDNSDCADLWIKYIDFAQADFLDFRYESCKTLFFDCLKMLASATVKESQDYAEPAVANIRLHMMLRLTVMMREAGYVEHAVALWQALLMFYLCRPRGLEDQTRHLSNESKRSMLLASFEEYWDSEVPRIGEEHYTDWAAEVDMNVNATVDSENPFRTFVAAEDVHAEVLRDPGRTTDDAAEDDPYHIILFPDLRDCLASMPLEMSLAPLIDALFCFMQISPFPQQGISTASWWLDPFLVNLQETPSLGSKPVSFVQHCRVTTEILFSTVYHSKVMKLSWTRGVFQALVKFSPFNDVLGEYYLAYEYHHSASLVRKTAKALLKKNPSSLRLYNAYALVESRSGNSSTASRTFATAIGMSEQLSQQAQLDVILLWRTWIWEALRVDDVSAARHRALSVFEAKPSPEPASGTHAENTRAIATLKAQRHLTEGRDHCLSSRNFYHATLYSECLSLLCYLTASDPIAAALEAFHKSSALFSAYTGSLQSNASISEAQELIHQGKAQLLAHHNARRIYKPSTVRSELTESIAMFPSNTIFLNQYADNEAHFRIDDRVRSIINDVVLKRSESTIIAHIFAVQSEMARGTEGGSTAYAVRGTFDRVLATSTGKHSAALWSLYFHFELSQGDMKRSKDVFLQGMTNLPWNKSFIMLAFRYLTEVMTYDELRRVYRVMGEKELRVFVDLEDVFEEVEARRVIRAETADQEVERA